MKEMCKGTCDCLPPPSAVNFCSSVVYNNIRQILESPYPTVDVKFRTFPKQPATKIAFIRHAYGLRFQNGEISIQK